MQFNLGKVKDAKDAGNTKKAKSASSEGMVGKSAGNTKLRPQNDANQTPGGPGEEGDAGVQMQEKRQKEIVRKNALYSDAAIAVAKKAHGIR